jgi:type I restriction enzyme R subunit
MALFLDCFKRLTLSILYQNFRLHKKRLSERDVCTKYIIPALVADNTWGQGQMREEVYFKKGRVLVHGKISKRGNAWRAD